MEKFVYHFEKFSDEELIPIHEEINEIYYNFDTSKSYNDKLAGHLKHQYGLTKCKKHVEKILVNYVDKFNRYTDFSTEIGVFKGYPKFELDHLWVNFQAKTEFNPPHKHSGLFSFVSWLKVPYDIQDEIALYPKLEDPNVQQTAYFNFQYIGPYGDLCYRRFPVDRSWENKILIFPAKTTHYVNPFYTSDEYRISISGNFFPV